MAVTMKELMLQWFCGNTAAVHFAEAVWDAAQKWDDMWDSEKPDRVANDDMLVWMAFSIDYHPFFMQHAAILRPVLLQMWLSWQGANALEATRQTEDDIAKAYMLRAGYYQMLHMMAWLIGGTAHARAMGPHIYRAYGETLADLRAEFPLFPSTPRQPEEGRFDA